MHNNENVRTSRNVVFKGTYKIYKYETMRTPGKG